MSFNEAHVLAITQAICGYRRQHHIDAHLRDILSEAQVIVDASLKGA